jgi:sugar O-acyltransferase (sialic acid O-acetyltransferase NeuD family)
MHRIIIQGAGGHARVVIDCALAQGHTIEGIFDPNSSGELYGIPIHSAYRGQDFRDSRMVVAIGDNAVRQDVVRAAQHSFVNVIHPSAMLSPYSALGLGNVIVHGVIVQAEAEVENHVILNTGSRIDHHCKVKDYVHIGPGVVLCGNVQIGEGSFIGAGTTIIPGKKVGAWSIVGAGSVVIDDIPDNVVAVGNPARVIKHCKPNMSEA